MGPQMYRVRCLKSFRPRDRRRPPSTFRFPTAASFKRHRDAGRLSVCPAVLMSGCVEKRTTGRWRARYRRPGSRERYKTFDRRVEQTAGWPACHRDDSWGMDRPTQRSAIGKAVEICDGRVRVTGLDLRAVVGAGWSRQLLVMRLGSVRREGPQSSRVTMPRRQLCTTF
jgi:hypothetical protein